MPRADVLPDLVNEAAHCRRLARGALPYDIALELERLAEEYEGRGGDRPIVRDRLSPPVVSRILLRTLLENGAMDATQPAGGKLERSSGSVDFLRELARFFVSASKSGTDQRARQYSAERAVELAQEAERLTRQAVMAGEPDHG